MKAMQQRHNNINTITPTIMYNAAASKPDNPGSFSSSIVMDIPDMIGSIIPDSAVGVFDGNLEGAMDGSHVGPGMVGERDGGLVGAVVGDAVVGDEVVGSAVAIHVVNTVCVIVIVPDTYNDFVLSIIFVFLMPILTLGDAICDESFAK